MPKSNAGEAQELMAREVVSRARRHIVETDSETLDTQIAVTEIPAPPFHEAARGEFVRRRLEGSGCRDVSTDDVGNILAWLGPTTPPPLVVSAHLDTVFPPGTDVSVTRSNGRLMGPGISDDGRGLAAILTLARTITTCNVPLAGPLLFVATVGEEGPGNLRGVRHLFESGGACSGARGFISLDGAGLSRVVNRGLGVLRLRAVVRGPGGHSWVDWGTPNPVHALGVAVERITKVPPRSGPAATATVARWGGGNSINAIPTEAWIELDLRSEIAGLLSRTVASVRAALDQAVMRINDDAPADREPLTLSVEVIGDRPAGMTPAAEPLVKAAVAATAALGVEARLIASSTDANVPMAAGVPAITLGAGGHAGGAHTEREWFENRGGADGIVRALLTALMVVGIADD